MVSPGAANWNEIYPDLATAYANVARFVADAKGARGMLGMFMTVWHDDGETLYEATWPSVAYAAATAWQAKPVDDATWHRTFARAFFGSDDPRYAADLDALQAIRPLIRTTPSDPPDYLFWRDPFDARVQARAQTHGSRGRAHARRDGDGSTCGRARPPLHRAGGRRDAARRVALRPLARRLQIGKEARDYYDDARAHAAKPDVSQSTAASASRSISAGSCATSSRTSSRCTRRRGGTRAPRPGSPHMLAHYRVARGRRAALRRPHRRRDARRLPPPRDRPAVGRGDAGSCTR